jgi:hypothetical protein
VVIKIVVGVAGSGRCRIISLSSCLLRAALLDVRWDKFRMSDLAVVVGTNVLLIAVIAIAYRLRCARAILVRVSRRGRSCSDRL